VNRSRIRRLVSLAGVMALALASIGVGPAAGKTPSGWDISAVRLPQTVHAGNDAGYAVTITNVGPSNINAVTASIVTSDTPDATPTYLSDVLRNQGDAVTCSSTGQLTCALGTLTPETVITFTVAYLVPEGTTGAFDLSLRLRAGTGDVEGGNQSRGDAFAKPVSTGINNNQNFDGGFYRPNAGGESTYATTGALGRTNRQTSEVVVSETGVTVNVADGSLVDTNLIQCDTAVIPDCGHGTEWTALSVPGHDGYIKVTLNVYGGSVDGGVSESELYVLHDPDSGPTYAITTRCDPPNAQPASGECLTATKVGSNWRVVVWLFNNGALRGTW
jgi:Domain of unknown function DUF11